MKLCQNLGLQVNSKYSVVSADKADPNGDVHTSRKFLKVFKNYKFFCIKDCAQISKKWYQFNFEASLNFLKSYFVLAALIVQPHKKKNIVSTHRLVSFELALATIIFSYEAYAYNRVYLKLVLECYKLVACLKLLPQ